MTTQFGMSMISSYRSSPGHGMIRAPGASTESLGFGSRAVGKKLYAIKLVAASEFG